MKVMFYYGTMANGGAERVIASLANDFVKRGDSVSIVVSDNQSAGYYIDNRINFMHLDTADVSSTAWQSAKRFVRTVYRLRENIKKIRPDIVFAFSPLCVVGVRLAAWGVKTKIVGSERSNPYIENTSRKLRMAVQLCNGIDGFVFQTEGARGFYPTRIQKKSAVIPNGLFAPIPKTVVPFNERESCSICATGRLSKVKRYDMLIDAFDQVKEKLPNWTVHIYGDGPMRQELQRMIDDKGLHHKIILEGRVNDIYEKLQKHRIFVLTSDNEGMPNGLLEAMACGLACVSVDCNFGPSELIRNGENGLLIPCRDVNALSDAMIRLATDNLFASQLASRAMEIRESHSAGKITCEIHSYLKNIKDEIVNQS